MNKQELIKAVQCKVEDEKEKFPLKLVGEFVEIFTEVVTEELAKKGSVTLVGFGTFAAAQRKAKTGINPKTGKKISIPAKTVPVFKAGKGLKETVK
jgi:nucleoid DNA-binding protein